MCGRARCTLRPEDVPRACHRHGLPSRFLHLECFRPSYNVAPGSYMPVLRRDSDGGVAVQCMKWGLVPGFTKKTDKPDFFKMFNARSESVAEKASFRRLLPKNRCLVTVDGFYEWKKEGSKKQPYYIHFKDERPLVFAALFDSWQNSGGETLYTFTILTTASSPALDWLHDRMPVILGERDSVDTWLDDPSTSKLQPLLAPYEKSDLVWYPVTPAIGKLSFDGPECIQQIPLKASQNSLISKFFSAKQPKTEERDKETISGGPKEEPILEGCEGVVVSESNDEIKQLDEEKEAQNLCFQKTVKAEPFTGDGSAIASSHPESVKKEGESVETGGGLEFTGESSQNSLISKFFSAKQPKTEERDKSTDATIPAGPKQERILEGVLVSDSNDEIKQVDEDKAEPFIGDSSAIVSPPEAVKKEVEEGEGGSVEETGGGLELTGECSGKSGRKRDYELFSSAQENPRKQSVVRLQDDKSSGKHGGRKKQGKGKYNMKKSKETTQSTLHFFFDEK